MKRIARLSFILGMFPLCAAGQSILEFQAGTTIEVQTGADICADSIAINGTYSGGGTRCGGPLPVELAALSATTENRSVLLSWTTATETNNFGFEVERRPSGALQPSDWHTVGFVKGAGVSTSPKKYVFTENKLSPGRYAYRLKQINNDGSFFYSTATEIEVAVPKEFALSQNYPNPFNPSTTISIALPVQSMVRVQVFDALGRVVADIADGAFEAGYHDVTWNASAASGTYIYRMEATAVGDANRRFTAVKKMLLLK